MRLELPRMGHEVTVCPDGATALAALERNTYDCILVDLDMPGCNGIDVIARAKQLSPDTEAVVLTGKSSLETAVAALRHGTFDYLTKPCKLVDLEAVLRRVAEKRELTNKYRAVKQRLERLEGARRPDRRFGEHAAGPPADRQGRPHRLHRADPRRDGHRQGAGRPGGARPEPAGGNAAGADQLRRAAREPHRERAVRPSQGRLHRGRRAPHRAVRRWPTAARLFLDEIGELPKAMQAKLLRFLESGEVRRVGENESFTCDVRVICATNRDLDEMVAAGEFREDLWFRINTFEIPLPPLRERIEDIPLLARHLAARFGAARGSHDEVFAPEALDRRSWSTRGRATSASWPT